MKRGERERGGERGGERERETDRERQGEGKRGEGKKGEGKKGEKEKRGEEEDRGRRKSKRERGRNCINYKLRSGKVNQLYLSKSSSCWQCLPYAVYPLEHFADPSMADT